MGSGGITGRGGSRLGTPEFGHVGLDRTVRLRAEEVARRGPAGVYGSVTPPSQEAIRRSVEAGICPLCGRGPFKVVSVHTNKKHGVDKYDLRDMAGMSMREPTCLPEFSAGARDRGKARTTPEEMRNMARLRDTSRPRRSTVAGVARQRANLERWIEANPDRMRLLRDEFRNRMTSPEALAKWEESMSRLRSERVYSEDEIARMVARLQSPKAQEARKATRQAKLAPCGTMAAYGRGCRCEPCRQAKRESRR